MIDSGVFKVIRQHGAILVSADYSSDASRRAQSREHVTSVRSRAASSRAWTPKCFAFVIGVDAVHDDYLINIMRRYYEHLSFGVSTSVCLRDNLGKRRTLLPNTSLAGGRS